MTVCASTAPAAQIRIKISASIEIRMLFPSNRPQNSASVATRLRRLNLEALGFARHLRSARKEDMHRRKSSLFALNQTFMLQLRFLDSKKRDKYGPRGFQVGWTGETRNPRGSKSMVDGARDTDNR